MRGLAFHPSSSEPSAFTDRTEADFGQVETLTAIRKKPFMASDIHGIPGTSLETLQASPTHRGRSVPNGCPSTALYVHPCSSGWLSLLE